MLKITGKIKKLYLLGDFAKTLGCFLFGALRTSSEIFAWPVLPHLLNCLPLSSDLVPKCFYGDLTTAGGGGDIPLNSTECCGSRPLGRGISGNNWKVCARTIW